MGVSVHWWNDSNDIVYYEFDGTWHWGDFYTAFEKSRKLQSSVPYRVDVIVDLTNSDGYPPNAISHVRKIAAERETNVHLSVLVTQNLFIPPLLKIAGRLSPAIAHDFRVAPTVEAALALIESDRRQTEAIPLSLSI